MATATFVQEGYESIDYTPASAVTAGDVIVQGDLVGIASLDIAANVAGVLSVRGVWDFAKATGSSSAITAGSKIYWDAVNEVATATAGGNKQIGKCILAATDDDTTVRVYVSQ